MYVYHVIEQLEPLNPAILCAETASQEGDGYPVFLQPLISMLSYATSYFSLLTTWFCHQTSGAKWNEDIAPEVERQRARSRAVETAKVYSVEATMTAWDCPQHHWAREAILRSIYGVVILVRSNKIKDRMTSSLSFEIDSAREEPWEATNHRAMMANY